LLASRIDRLSEREKLVLQAAAVIGRRFASQVLRGVLQEEFDGSDDALAGSLDALEQTEFIRRASDDREIEYAFKHPLTQSVAYGSQRAEVRARRHVAVARTLQALHGDGLGQYAGAIAPHFATADWKFEAMKWRRRAALRVTGIEVSKGPKRHV